MRESNADRVEIKEAKSSSFRLLLQYIYTGKINLKNEKVCFSSSSSFELTHSKFNYENKKEDLLIDLLGLVHQYGFIELQNSISNYLESILSLKNICSIYDIACLYNLKSLAETCARFIDRNCASLIKTSSLTCLSSVCAFSSSSFLNLK